MIKKPLVTRYMTTLRVELTDPVKEWGHILQNIKQENGHKEKKRNIENLTQIQFIVVEYSGPNPQLFYNFIILLSIYTLFNGN